MVVCDVPGSPRGGSWGTSGEILFARANGPGIERVPASGGTATAVTTVNRQAGELRHVSPVVLADGRSFVFTAVRADPGGSAGDLQLVSAGVSGPVLMLSNAMHSTGDRWPAALRS